MVERTPLHVPAAFINALAEEGTKDEAIFYLQKQWNETCALKARIQDLEEQAIVLQARGDLAVENRNYWQAEAERLSALQPRDSAK